MQKAERMIDTGVVGEPEYGAVFRAALGDVP